MTLRCAACGHENPALAVRCHSCRAALVALPGELEARIVPLLRHGRRQAAIELYDQSTDAGPHESAAAIDRLSDEHGLTPGGGCLTVLALLFFGAACWSASG